MAKSRSAEDPAVVQARESRRLSTLLEISHALSGTLNLRSALHRALEILAKHHGTVRSLIVFLHDNRDLTRILLRLAEGLDAEADELLVSAYRRVGTHRINAPRLGPLYGALLKNEQDVSLFEKIAFMARRGG